MKKPLLKIIKIGGNIIDDPASLQLFVTNFSSLSGPCILVHGGGKIATAMGDKLGIQTTMVEGRRITCKDTVDVITMVYAGLVNKKIVAALQSAGRNALGLSGVDGNSLPAVKRPAGEIDYGFAGDVEASKVNTGLIDILLKGDITPVFCSVTHDGKGQLLNTNADTIASTLSVALSHLYEVKLYYCFEKSGVLRDVNKPESIIPVISREEFSWYRIRGVINEGMIPKLSNAFDAIGKGVQEVVIGNATEILNENATTNAGTRLVP